MSEYFSNYHIMHRNAAVLTVILCILLYLTFNNTFPLHRQSRSLIGVFANRSPVWEKPHKVPERTKKMAIDIENTLRKIKDSTKDIGRNLYEHINTGLKSYSMDKNTFSEDDLQQYEQLVIMKKYPYLDFKELEMKYSPSNKNVRQSIKFDSGLGSDPSICEPVDDGLNVEIINRGLSGFAIPAKLKSHRSFDSLYKTTKLKKSTEHSMLEKLQDALVQFQERKKYT